YSAQAAASQISRKSTEPITTHSLERFAYLRCAADSVIRPLPSGLCSSALAARLRINARASGFVRDTAAALRALSANSSRGYTAKEWSCPFVTISPPASSSRNIPVHLPVLTTPVSSSRICSGVTARFSPLPTRCAPLSPPFPHLQPFYTQAISTFNHNRSSTAINLVGRFPQNTSSHTQNTQLLPHHQQLHQ